MNFAIEAAGEASPLSLDELCRILQLASSHDHNQRQSAGQQLTSWESHQDYYPALQTVFLNSTIPREVRFLAIIQLKNGIDKYWRSYSQKCVIPAAEKHLIRSRLFEGTVGQEDKQLAFHNALVVAKVVRIDSPQDWPDALSKVVYLLRTTKDGNQAHLSGVLVVLLRIVKELGTARLRKSQTALQSITPELVYVLCEIYGAKTGQWLEFLTNAQGDEDAADLAMECSLTTFKILRRLLVVGYNHPHKDSTVQQVWTFSQAQFDQFLGFVSHDSPIPAPYLDVVGKHLLQFTKLHLEMATSHGPSFAALPNSLDLVRAYWNLVAKFAEVYDRSGGIRQQRAASPDTKSKMEGPLLEKLALKGLRLIRCCVRMVHYPHQTIKYRSQDIIKESEQAIQHVKSALFTNDLVVQMANSIISHLFVFRRADFEAWEEDPQEWEHQEAGQGDAHEWEVRPCAEKLFFDLLTHYKSLLFQPLLSYFNTIANPQADIPTKEAVYTAMGLAAPIVHTDFDFDTVLKTNVSNDAQYTGPFCQVIRRRIAILLSEWVPIHVTAEGRTIVYGMFRHFLNPNDPSNDIVVRITAARHLKAVVDEFEFNSEAFLPVAGDVLSELIGLVGQAEVNDTKLAILETTRSILERLESHASKFGDYIISALPGIWESAGELGTMLKQSVLSILQTLVMAMKGESQRYQPQTLPLIAEALQEGTELYLYLIEEALELWHNVLLQTSPPLVPELITLAEPAINQLMKNNEHSSKCLSILGCYVILAPEKMLEDRWRQPVLAALSAGFDTKSREQQFEATKYTDAFIRFAHELGGEAGLQLVVRDMVETGYLSKILEGIHDSFEAHQTSGPKRKTSRLNAITLADFLTVLARIAVIEPRIFVEMLTGFGPLDAVWNWFSAEWFSSFDTMADISRKKLHLLAVTRLLELPSPVQGLLLAKLQDYFSMWTSVLLELLDDSDHPGMDTIVLQEPLEPTEWDTAKDVKERALHMSDPVKTVESLPFVKERLQILVQNVGGEEQFAANWLVNVDKDVVAGFQALGTAGHSGQ